MNTNGWVPTEGADRATAIQRFLAQFSEAERAEALHLVLQALRARVEPDRVLACELAWEVHTRAYWSQLKGEEGRPYESEEDYFRTVLGLASWRTAYKRLAIGRMLTAFPEPERAPVRAAIAEVGVAKASVIVPAIERTGQWPVWVDWARQLAYPVLQARVSEALQAVPRGREPEAPGERFRRAILAGLPDIEAMEVVERFFELGAKVVGTPHPIGIFLAGCRECLAEWEVQAARGRRRQPVSASEASPDLDHSLRDDRDVEGASLPARCGGLPTWAKMRRRGPAMKRTVMGQRARRRVRAGGPRATGRPAASLDDWATIKALVLARAGWRCQACGFRRRLDVHHVVKRAQGGSDFDLDRLVALCRPCHAQTDAAYAAGRLVVTPLGAGRFLCALMHQRSQEESEPTRAGEAGVAQGTRRVAHMGKIDITAPGDGGEQEVCPRGQTRNPDTGLVPR